MSSNDGQRKSGAGAFLGLVTDLLKFGSTLLKLLDVTFEFLGGLTRLALPAPSAPKRIPQTGRTEDRQMETESEMDRRERWATLIVACCFLIGIIAALGGLVQIDPVWLYGPYEPGAVMAGAQPDWYMGWVEGAMRLFPGVNLHLGHWLIPELFFPAVVMPSVVFGTLYLVPFVEKLFSRDDEDHNVLLLPYEQPIRTAVGVGTVVFMLVLLTAGGDDVIAVATGWSVVDLRTILRIAVFILPLAAALLAYFVCIGLRNRKAAQTISANGEISWIGEDIDECVFKLKGPLAVPVEE
ncbi:MAG TPA: hypothetical protein VGN16_09800, partial [Acidobacteriaceae bacterium]